MISPRYSHAVMGDWSSMQGSGVAITFYGRETTAMAAREACDIYIYIYIYLYIIS